MKYINYGLKINSLKQNLMDFHNIEVTVDIRTQKQCNH